MLYNTGFAIHGWKIQWTTFSQGGIVKYEGLGEFKDTDIHNVGLALVKIANSVVKDH
ncbi:hypothetical protein ACSXCO_14965 (plasmid) [Clostridium perfringens]